MPVLQTPDGIWMSDTTEIIETLETWHPQPSIALLSPRHKILAMLLEAWFDDSWITAAMYTRWMYPESYELFKQEGGQALLPFCPTFIRNKVIEKTAMAKLRAYLPGMGITAEQNHIIDTWLRAQLTALDAHFSEHQYFFGDRPSIADYGLLGPMYGHLNRDPWPKRELIDHLPSLQGWTQRTHAGSQSSGDFLSQDVLPATLLPILQTVINEFLPMVKIIVEKAELAVVMKGLKAGDALPRVFTGVSFLMGADQFSRNVFSYTLWMMQRIQKCYKSLSEAEQKSVDDLFIELGARGFMQSNLGPEVKRHGLGVKLA